MNCKFQICKLSTKKKENLEIFLFSNFFFFRFSNFFFVRFSILESKKNCYYFIKKNLELLKLRTFLKLKTTLKTGLKFDHTKQHHWGINDELKQFQQQKTTFKTKDFGK